MVVFQINDKQLEFENTLSNLCNKFKLKKKESGVAFILIGKFKDDIIKILREKVNQKFDNAIVISSEEDFDENIYLNKFLISYVSVTKFSQLDRVNNSLILEGNKPKGIIILDPFLS